MRLLDDLFSKLIPLLDDYGGVYLRDEGDCLVGIFTSYFGEEIGPANVRSFARRPFAAYMAGKTYPKVQRE